MIDGKITRTPGGYYRVDPDTGRQTSKLLRDTNEYIHPSARSRIERKGPGLNDEGVYDCPALDPYKLRHMDGTTTKRPSFFWAPRSRRKRSNLHELPESPLRNVGKFAPLLFGIVSHGNLEKDLLAESPKMNDYVLGASNPKGSPDPERSLERR